MDHLIIETSDLNSWGFTILSVNWEQFALLSNFVMKPKSDNSYFIMNEVSPDMKYITLYEKSFLLSLLHIISYGLYMFSLILQGDMKNI